MQQLNPSEISEVIKARIDQLDVSSEARNEGTIVSVTDGIIRIHGLTDVMFGEMIEFDATLLARLSLVIIRVWLKDKHAAVQAVFWKCRLVLSCRAA